MVGANVGMGDSRAILRAKQASKQASCYIFFQRIRPFIKLKTKRKKGKQGQINKARDKATPLMTGLTGNIVVFLVSKKSFKADSQVRPAINFNIKVDIFLAANTFSRKLRNKSCVRGKNVEPVYT